MSSRVLRIATRESPLAMWQAEYVADLLRQHGHDTQIVPLVSSGDIDMAPIDGTRQVGVFTKRIQRALVDDEGDIAVHSLKDLPTDPDARFVLGAVPPRETVADSLVSPSRFTIETLPENARIGTGSRRRAAQLRSIRDDLQILPIRGNVQTRLAKLEAGDYDAIVLAEAGLHRLKMTELARVTLSVGQMLPAPGQAALGIEVRSDDREAIDAVAKFDDAITHACVVAERRVLSRLHGGCLAPIAALAQVSMTEPLARLSMQVVVLSPDGAERLDREHSTEDVSLEGALRLADHISDDLDAAGAGDLIQQGRS